MYGGHVATIDPGMCPYTEIARTLEFQRSMEIAVEKAPEHFKEYAEYSYMRGEYY